MTDDLNLGNEPATDTADRADERIVVAQATPGAQPGAPGAAAQAVALQAPAAGQHLVIPVQAGKAYQLTFDPATAQASLKDGNLVLTFPNGGDITLQNFAQVNPQLIFPDGTIVAGNIVVAQIGGAAEAMNLETAAGPGATGGGNNVYNDDLGDVIAGLDPQDVIPPTALQFPEPTPSEEVLGLLEEAAVVAGCCDFVPPELGTELFGTDGNDFLVGSNGGDLFHGSGNTDLYGGEPEVEVQVGSSSGFDVLVGHNGADTADYSDPAFDDINADLGLFYLPYFGFVGVAEKNFAEGGEGFDVLLSIDNMVGSDVYDGSDSIEGSEGNNVIDGGEGDDSLYGDGGDDVLDGGEGWDELNGGSDDEDGDTVDYSDAPGAVVVSLFDSKADEDGWGSEDRLWNIENVIGSAYGDEIEGSEGDNRLEGRGGNDSIYGGAGEDTLNGGDGDDELDGGSSYYCWDEEDDTVDYSDAPDAVAVSLWAGKATGGAGNDTLWNFENVIGSAFDDYIEGNSDSNALMGDFEEFDGGYMAVGGYDLTASTALLQQAFVLYNAGDFEGAEGAFADAFYSIALDEPNFTYYGDHDSVEGGDDTLVGGYSTEQGYCEDGGEGWNGDELYGDGAVFAADENIYVDRSLQQPYDDGGASGGAADWIEALGDDAFSILTNYGGWYYDHETGYLDGDIAMWAGCDTLIGGDDILYGDGEFQGVGGDGNDTVALGAIGNDDLAGAWGDGDYLVGDVDEFLGGEYIASAYDDGVEGNVSFTGGNDLMIGGDDQLFGGNDDFTYAGEEYYDYSSYYYPYYPWTYFQTSESWGTNYDDSEELFGDVNYFSGAEWMEVYGGDLLFECGDDTFNGGNDLLFSGDDTYLASHSAGSYSIDYYYYNQYDNSYSWDNLSVGGNEYLTGDGAEGDLGEDFSVAGDWLPVLVEGPEGSFIDWQFTGGSATITGGNDSVAGGDDVLLSGNDQFIGGDWGVQLLSEGGEGNPGIPELNVENTTWMVGDFSDIDADENVSVYGGDLVFSGGNDTFTGGNDTMDSGTDFISAAYSGYSIPAVDGYDYSYAGGVDVEGLAVLFGDVEGFYGNEYFEIYGSDSEGDETNTADISGANDVFTGGDDVMSGGGSFEGGEGSPYGLGSFIVGGDIVIGGEGGEGYYAAGLNTLVGDAGGADLGEDVYGDESYYGVSLNFSGGNDSFTGGDDDLFAGNHFVFSYGGSEPDPVAEDDQCDGTGIQVDDGHVLIGDAGWVSAAEYFDGLTADTTISGGNDTVTGGNDTIDAGVQLLVADKDQAFGVTAESDLSNGSVAINGLHYITGDIAYGDLGDEINEFYYASLTFSGGNDVFTGGDDVISGGVVAAYGFGVSIGGGGSYPGELGGAYSYSYDGQLSRIFGDAEEIDAGEYLDEIEDSASATLSGGNDTITGGDDIIDGGGTFFYGTYGYSYAVVAEGVFVGIGDLNEIYGDAGWIGLDTDLNMSNDAEVTLSGANDVFTGGDDDILAGNIGVYGTFVTVTGGHYVVGDAGEVYAGDSADVSDGDLVFSGGNDLITGGNDTLHGGFIGIDGGEAFETVTEQFLGGVLVDGAEGWFVGDVGYGGLDDRVSANDESTVDFSGGNDTLLGGDDLMYGTDIYSVVYDSYYYDTEVYGPGNRLFGDAISVYMSEHVSGENSDLTVSGGNDLFVGGNDTMYAGDVYDVFFGPKTDPVTAETLGCYWGQEKASSGAYMVGDAEYVNMGENVYLDYGSVDVSGGNDTVDGGDDLMFGSLRDDVLIGDVAEIRSGEYAEIYAYGGGSTLTGGNDLFTGGNDTIDGGEGSDTLIGDVGSIQADGDFGADTFTGGNDVLDGGEGSDWLVGDFVCVEGGEGDVFIGGNDTLTGDDEFSGWDDYFVFSMAYDTGDDVITDFEGSEGGGGDVLAFEHVVDLDSDGIDIEDAVSSFSKSGDVVTLGLTNGGSITITDVNNALNSLSDVDANSMINGA